MMNFLENIIENLQNETESSYLEFKESENNLPKDFWETYSAFANTSGGFVILGIKEKPFEIVGIKNPNKLIKDLFNLSANTDKVNLNLLSSSNVEQRIVNDKTIISIYIPEAPMNQKPVFFNKDIRNTFIRRNDGDYRATTEELKRFIRNSSDNNDNELLSDYTIDDLDTDSILELKSTAHSRYPARNFIEMDNEKFLETIGVFQIDRNDNRKLKLTLAGLLFLGKYEAIQQLIPHFHLEYLNQRGSTESRWRDRVSSGDISLNNMNLYNFYKIVLEKLRATVEEPFDLDERMVRKSSSDLRESLREALANTLIHADYQDPETSIKIVVTNYFYSFLNPGIMKISKEQFFTGGKSQPRNNCLITLFRLIGASERVGDGGRIILATTEKNNFRHPELETDLHKTFLKIWTAALVDSYPELSKNAVKVLLYIKENHRVSKSQIMKDLNLSDYYTRHALEEILSKEYITKFGKSKNTAYLWNPTRLETIAAVNSLVKFVESPDFIKK